MQLLKIHNTVVVIFLFKKKNPFLPSFVDSLSEQLLRG